MSVVFGGEPIKGPERFAFAFSEHPIPSIAIGELAGELLERVGEGADLVVLYVTAAHAGALEDMSAAIQTLLDPKVMIGCAAEGVVADGHQVLDDPGVVVWAGDVGPVAPLRLEVVDAPVTGKAIAGWPIGLDYVPAGAIVLSDPFSFPVPALFQQLNNAGGFPRTVGAMVAAGAGPGTSRLVLDGEVYTDGAVGVLLKGTDDVVMQTAVARGARGVGTAFLVTAAAGNVIEELDGEPAYRALARLANHELEGADVERAERGLVVGKALDPSSSAEDNFAIRSLLAADAWAGTLTIGERVQVGDVIRFHLPDPEFAYEQLNGVFEFDVPDDEEVGGQTQEEGEIRSDWLANLVFVDSARARAFFSDAKSDAAIIAAGSAWAPPFPGVIGEATFGPTHGLNAVQGLAVTAAFFAAKP